MSTARVTRAEYRALAAVRYRIRRFLAFSEQAARAAGIEPQQHQLLLAIRGLPPGERATITAIADRLQIRHHSAVELVSRAEAAGLVARRADPDDARRLSVQLTRRGLGLLERLSREHRAELAATGAELMRDLRILVRATRGAASVR